MLLGGCGKAAEGCANASSSAAHEMPLESDAHERTLMQ